MDKNGVHYEDSDKRVDLVERIKQAGYKINDKRKIYF